MDPRPRPRFYPNSNFSPGWLSTVEISGKKLLYLGLCVLSLFAVLAVLFYSFVGIFGDQGKEILKSSWYAFENFVLSNGFWLFCSIAVLPIFVLPVSPLLILAGKWVEPIARGCLASTPSSLLQSTLVGLIGSQENREIQ